MFLWKKIDNFFAPKPKQSKGAAAAAAAAAAADIFLYVKDLITRPERAKKLIERVQNFQKLTHDQQAIEFIPLYVDLESYVVKHEAIKHYTKASLRLEIYTAINLKKSSIPFLGFFTPEIEGAFLLMQELFSKWADPAYVALGKEKVGEIILNAVENTVFDGVKYKDGVLDFANIQSRLEHDNPTEKDFKKVFNTVSDGIVEPIKELRGKTPSVYLLRKKVLGEWHLLHYEKNKAWQEQGSVIPITPKASSIMTNLGMGELITKGIVKGIETDLLPMKGEAKPVSVSASALKDEAGNIFGMVMVAKDLTEIRRLEQDRILALETANMQADALVKERTADLEAAHNELQERIIDLERFNKIAIGRELKMIELKKKMAKIELSLK